MIVLISKWDSNEESAAKRKYHVNWSGEPSQEPNENITSVLCLPLAASQSRSSAHCGPDWTAIVVGYSSGAVRFYTENGSLLLSEVLHEESVTGLKCQSYQPARYSAGSEQNEELHVIYKNVVCSVFGFALCNTLRACRNQLARVQANCSDSTSSFLPPPLSLRKFSLQEQGTVSDLFVGPIQCPPAFTHLATASICGGYNASYRPTPPQSSLVIATGSKPFVGFHYAIEGSSAPVLTDVAKAMATKLKSAIGQAVPGWLLGGKKTPVQQEKTKEVIEPAEPMACRFGLCDLWRQGDQIVMSPNRKLCVVSDTLGRVILVDNTSGIAVRMWKGYREAECGWIMCHEDERGNEKRIALFLVIYAPKKGIIEVWAMQQGPRVATYPASKTGRLLHTGHGLLGVSSVSSKINSHNTSSCVFVDHLGAFREITVPFHCALSDKNSKRARDILLLKRLKTSLREENGLSEINNTCKELQTNEMKGQALDIMCSSCYITADLLFDVINLFTPALASSTQDKVSETLDPGGKSLLDKCTQLEHLVTFYQFLSRLRQKPPSYNTIISECATDDAQRLCQLIQTTSEEVDRALSLANSTSKSGVSRVKFQDSSANVSSFIQGFQVSSEAAKITLNKSISPDKILAISEMVYQGYLDGNCSINEWQNAACESCILPFDLMSLAVSFWINKHAVSNSVALEMIRFSELIRAICLIAGKSVNWWTQVRTMLCDSEDPIAALTAALVCRYVALSVDDLLPGDTNNDGNKKEIDSHNNNDDNANDNCDKNKSDSETGSSNDVIMDWENVSQETCQWSQLISQLEDVALLYYVLSQKLAQQNSEIQQRSVLDYKTPKISLNLVLSKGKGSIPEMVAKWIMCSGLDPVLLVEHQNIENINNAVMAKQQNPVQSMGVIEGVAEETEHSVEAQPTNEMHNKVLEDLSKLREHFPYSLASNSLSANLCWEHVLTWNKDIDSLTNLLSAINCLVIISDPHLRQGICTMIWSMHLRLRFEAALRLINKVGKVPKERLCRQDIGLSDLHIPDFFKFCSDFINLYMESNVMCEINEKVSINSESFWEGCSLVPSLSQLALGQPVANYDLLNLLSQAARAMLLLTTFNLRTHRPLAAFFDSVGQSALFSEVWSRPQLPGYSQDVKLSESRIKFLLRSVAAAMGTIISHQQQWDTKQAVQWMSQCLSLAADWLIAADPLRRQQACQLYAKGFDRLAEEVIPSVTDTAMLGSQLLIIAGQRLNKLLSSDKDLCKLSNLSPVLTSWINEIGDGSVENSTISETVNLSTVALNFLSDDHPLWHIARQLVDSLQRIAAQSTSSASSSSMSDSNPVISSTYVT
ncbi:rab3 GTPase activating protein isoform X2 [Lycorma delicatula]|uniref:rab3 GTPase activating protein isoform X2 n=1 Tax=Lycorma delicatula TaxID=130591 RepID=UPI003F510F9A